MNRITSTILAAAASFGITSTVLAEDHFDIAPYFQNDTLLTGGLDHGGNHTPPPITVYGYEFGEDTFDPFNPSDPGVNQAAGVGGLPAGAALRYNILSSLRYWDGSGPEVEWGAPGGQTHVGLMVGATSRTITGASGFQTGSLIQTVASDGSVHKHFITSLFADNTSSNVPGELTYVAPSGGIYAFSLELTLTLGSTTYVSEPFWMLFNNGMSEPAHDAAMESVPEPAGISAGLIGLAGMTMRRRRW